MDLNAVIKTIHDNPVLMGGAGLGVAGTLFASLKALPKQLSKWIFSLITLSVTVHSGDNIYTWVKDYLDQNENTAKARRITAFIHYGSIIKYFPGSGNVHLFWDNGRLFWMYRTIADKPDNYGKLVETTTIYTFGRSQKILRDFFSRVDSHYNKTPYVKTKIYLADDTYWSEFSRRTPRSLESIILDTGLKERLTNDITNFKNSEKKYLDLCIPYRRGYLFHGPPGSGKTSLAAALAGYLKYHLYVLSFASGNLTDESLLHLISKVPTNGILLMEDIDAAFNLRESINQSKVTFSGLLNALDGVATREGQIFIISTNHKEKLDPALLRPGRIDLELFLDNASEYQAKELYSRFDKNTEKAAAFAEEMKGQPMAKLQNTLLERFS